MPQTITKQEIQARVYSALEEFGADPDALAPDATFEALDVDSLDLVELAQIVQDEYGVELKGEDMPKLKTVGDAVDLIAARAGA
jgi:acyl carrier protein